MRVRDPVRSCSVASRACGVVVALAAGALPRVCSADPPATSQPPAAVFDLGAGTYFPLALAAEGTIELPYRILLQADAGWMPSPYSNTVVDLLDVFGVIDSFEEVLIKTAIQSSFVGRVSAGWRPFPALGLEVLGGYTLLTAGGGISGADVVDAYLQSKGSSDQVPSDSNRGVPLHTTLQSFHVAAGWRWPLLDDKLVLRASLGYLQCFASSTSVGLTPARPADQAVVSHIDGELQGFLNPYFVTYVKVPVLGLTAAYRF